MASEEALGKSLNECPEEYDRITMYVDGVHVWGEAPEAAKDELDATSAADILAPSTTTKNTDSTALYGDVNCDKKVTIADAVLLCRVCAEDTTAKITEQGKVNADCNRDGKTTNDDTNMILKFLAGLIKQSALGTK